MLDFNHYKVLTFDCYGTLIDWETGILNALKPLLSAHAVELADSEMLGLYAEFEAELEQGTYQKYHQILSGVVQKFGQKFDFVPTAEEIAALPESLQSWPPFPDTVDDDLFAYTAELLQVKFDDVITAAQLQSYKPNLNNFKTMMQRVHTLAGILPEEILHVAQSIYHDIIPARSLGLSTVWVARRQGQSGAALAAEGQPDLTVPDMQTLASLVNQ
jgi:2-haloacid dehalogenase